MTKSQGLKYGGVRKRVERRVSRLTDEQWHWLSQLDPIYVAVLIGRFVNGLSVAKLARRLRIGDGSVYKLCDAALHLLGIKTQVDRAARNRAEESRRWMLYRARLEWVLEYANSCTAADTRLAHLRLRLTVPEMVRKTRVCREQIHVVLKRLTDGMSCRAGLPRTAERCDLMRAVLGGHGNPKALAEQRILEALCRGANYQDEAAIGTNWAYSNAIVLELWRDLEASGFKRQLAALDKAFPERLTKATRSRYFRRLRRLWREMRRVQCVVKSITDSTRRERRYIRARLRGGRIRDAADAIGQPKHVGQAIELALIGALFNIDQRREGACFPRIPKDRDLPLPSQHMLGQEKAIARYRRLGLWYD